MNGADDHLIRPGDDRDSEDDDGEFIGFVLDDQTTSSAMSDISDDSDSDAD